MSTVVGRLQQRIKYYSEKIRNSINTSNSTDIFDGIYPILKLCRFAGFLPWTCDKAGKKASRRIEFRWLSLPVFWYLTCFSMCLYFSLMDLALVAAVGFSAQRNKFTENSKSGQNGSETEMNYGSPPLFQDDLTGSNNAGIDLSGLQGLWDFVLPVYLGIVLANLLRTCLTLIFTLLFFEGLSFARKAPKYLSKLEGCFTKICNTSERRRKLIRRVRWSMFKSLVLYFGLLMTDLIHHAVIMPNLKAPLKHPFVRTGAFMFQLWYTSHVMLAILTSSIILITRLLFKESNQQLAELLQAPENQTEKNGDAKDIKDVEPGWKFCDDFDRLKLGIIQMEDLLHKRNFILSGFVTIELLIVLIHFTAFIPIACSSEIDLNFHGAFEIVYHSVFAVKLVFDATRMTDESKKSEFIVTKACLDHVPLGCHAEVSIFATKVLKMVEPAVQFFGYKLNQDLISKIQTGLMAIALVALIAGYIILAVRVIPGWIDWTFGLSLDVTNTSLPDLQIPGISDLYKMRKSFFKFVNPDGVNNDE